MNNYNFLQKKLHKLVLGFNFVKNSLFEIEKKIFLSNKNIKKNNHIFISGLPRSGTTSLLNFLYSTDEFASLTYKDMPFVLSPNIFSKLSLKKKIPKTERIHQDGISYDQDSPDTFDEVLFLTFKESECFENYNYLISLILNRYEKEKYLSKNNNNYKRIDEILSCYPQSVVLIPFREPLQHANSLIQKHFMFIEKQSEDPFILDYMNFLGHYEFGLNHRYWLKPISYSDTKDINYWLEQWNLFYTNLGKKYLEKKNNVFFINYENLCKKESSKKILEQKLSLVNSSNFQFKYSSKDIKINFDENLLEQCKNTYDKLTSNSLI